VPFVDEDWQLIALHEVDDAVGKLVLVHLAKLFLAPHYLHACKVAREQPFLLLEDG